MIAEMSAIEKIKVLKRLYRATTDQELADKLGASVFAVRNWKQRNSLPKKYELIIARSGEKPKVTDALSRASTLKIKERKMTVRDELDDLKFRLRLKTDQQLAVALNTTKVSIDKWISKKAIPQKWRRIIELQYPKSHNRLKIPIFYKEREMTHSCEACREHSGASETKLPVEVLRYWFEEELCEHKRLDALIAELEFDLAQAKRNMERSDHKIDLARSVLNSLDPQSELSNEGFRNELIRVFNPDNLPDPIGRVLRLL